MAAARDVSFDLFLQQRWVVCGDALICKREREGQRQYQHLQMVFDTLRRGFDLQSCWYVCKGRGWNHFKHEANSAVHLLTRSDLEVQKSRVTAKTATLGLWSTYITLGVWSRRLLKKTKTKIKTQTNVSTHVIDVIISRARKAIHLTPWTFICEYVSEKMI